MSKGRNNFMEDTNQRKSGAILSYVSIIASTLVQLIYIPFLIKMLGQSEYGLYSLINSVIGYLTILDLGFGNAIVVYTAKYREQGKYEEEKKLHGMFFIVFCIIGAIVGLLGVILYFNVNNLFGNTMSDAELHKAKIMMLILTFNLVISFVFSIFSSILNAYEKFVYQKVISILNIILRPIIMIPLLFMGFKSITMVIVITILNMIVLLSNYFYCKKKLNVRVKYRGFDKVIFKTILGYSVWIFLSTIVDKVNWSVDQFVLGSFVGTTAVSVYAVAGQINTLFINLSTAISGVLLPKVSTMIAREATKYEITSEFIKVGRIQYYIIFLMASALILFGKEFFIAWVGNEYVNSYYIALILILPLCIPLIQNIGISIMQAKEMHKFRSILYLFIAIANIIVSIPLAIRYQGIGCAIGTALSLIIGNGLIINIYYFNKVGINVLKFWKEIIKMTIPNIIPIVLIIIVMKNFQLSGFINVIVYGSIYTILYCITCYYISMNEYEKGLINGALLKLKIKRE